MYLCLYNRVRSEQNSAFYENETRNRGELASQIHQRALADFTGFILLTNFQKYVEIFAEHFKVPIVVPMPTSKRLRRGITIINFGMGVPTQPR